MLFCYSYSTPFFHLINIYHAVLILLNIFVHDPVQQLYGFNTLNIPIFKVIRFNSGPIPYCELMICVYFTNDTQAMFDDVVQYAPTNGFSCKKLLLVLSHLRIYNLHNNLL